MDTEIHILIVDDDEFDRMNIIRSLRSSGFTLEVDEVIDCKQAQLLAQENKFDCIFLDYMLPDGDGLHLLKQLRSAGNQTPIIMLTGHGDVRLAVEMIRAGASDYIPKSQVGPDALLHSVNNALRLARAERQRKQVEEDLQKTTRRMVNILESISDAFFAVNENWQFTYINNQAEQLLLTDRHNLINSVIWDELPNLPDWFQTALRRSMQQSKAEHCEGYHEQIGKWLEIQVYPSSSGITTYFRDVSERKAAEERLIFLANYDALTGLPNRALLLDRLGQTLTRTPWHNRYAAVLFCDLNRFKLVNDTLGHNTGDHLLKTMAKRFQACVRDGDTVGRLGGDEFVIILSDLANPTDVSIVAKKIVDCASEPVLADNHEIFSGASIGISIFPDDARDAETLLKYADTAMYKAKEQGKSCYQFYSPALDTSSSDRLSIENDMRAALEHDEFQLYFQPQVELTSGRIVGAEALIRWLHPQRGLIPPNEFLPVAEESGLILPIGEWVCETACRLNKSWQDTGLPAIHVAVNLSNCQFQQNEMPKMLERALTGSGLEAQWLELELTENILMKNTQKAITTMQELRSLGVKLSIDDFGTGYTSLAYLSRFPIQVLKVDRSFINDISDGANGAVIVEAIIALAHKLNLSVVAEGVETEIQRRFLLDNDCDVMQGYLFSRPLPADEFTELLSKHTAQTVTAALRC